MDPVATALDGRQLLRHHWATGRRVQTCGSRSGLIDLSAITRPLPRDHDGLIGWRRNLPWPFGVWITVVGIHGLEISDAPPLAAGIILVADAGLGGELCNHAKVRLEEELGVIRRTHIAVFGLGVAGPVHAAGAEQEREDEREN